MQEATTDNPPLQLGILLVMECQVLDQALSTLTCHLTPGYHSLVSSHLLLHSQHLAGDQEVATRVVSQCQCLLDLGVCQTWDQGYLQAVRTCHQVDQACHNNSSSSLDNNNNNSLTHNSINKEFNQEASLSLNNQTCQPQWEVLTQNRKISFLYNNNNSSSMVWEECQDTDLDMVSRCRLVCHQPPAAVIA